MKGRRSRDCKVNVPLKPGFVVPIPEGLVTMPGRILPIPPTNSSEEPFKKALRQNLWVDNSVI